jgi:hypothetical protein
MEERKIRKAIDLGVNMAQNWKGTRTEDRYMMRGGGNRVGIMSSCCHFKRSQRVTPRSGVDLATQANVYWGNTWSKCFTLVTNRSVKMN